MPKKDTSPLSIVEKEYIENHASDQTPEELAAVLNKPLDNVRRYLHTVQKADTRVNRLLGRHSSGAVVMTAGASAASDERRAGPKDLQKLIQSAADAGDFEEANRLKQQLRQAAIKAANERVNPRGTDHIHRVRQPDFQEHR